jgi:hypothetical protein
VPQIDAAGGYAYGSFPYRRRSGSAGRGARRPDARPIALVRHAGAEIVEWAALDDFDARLGPEFLKGFARRVDAAFATFPATRRNWQDVCTSR